MTKTKSTEFGCDYPKCKKKVKVNTDEYCPANFPYDKGWLYIYNHQAKSKPNNKILITDAHFCCKEHLLKFLEMQIDISLEDRE